MDHNDQGTTEEVDTDTELAEDQTFLLDLSREGTFSVDGQVFDGERVHQLFNRLLSKTLILDDPQDVLRKSLVMAADLDSLVDHPEAYVRLEGNLYDGHIFKGALMAFERLLLSDRPIWRDSTLYLRDDVVHQDEIIPVRRAEALINDRLGVDRAPVGDYHRIPLEDTRQLGYVDQVIVDFAVQDADAVRRTIRLEHKLLRGAGAVIPCKKEHVQRDSVWDYNGMRLVPGLLMTLVGAIVPTCYASLHDMLAPNYVASIGALMVVIALMLGTLLGALPVAMRITLRHRQAYGTASPALFWSAWAATVATGFVLLIFASEATMAVIRALSSTY